MKLSVYTYLFNARVRDFDLNGTIDNFVSFFDEAVIATVPSEDDTYERLLKRQKEIGSDRLKIVMTDIPIKGNNRFDGQLKTAALKQCSHPIRVIADCDERFVVGQRRAWEDLGRALLNSDFDGFYIPVIDLYKSKDTIRVTNIYSCKFRIHKSTVAERGVPKFAEKGNGLIFTSRSDTTEPLDINGNLSHFAAIYTQDELRPSQFSQITDPLYVLHYGTIDLERRAKLGKEFWLEHWTARSQEKENVATTVEELETDDLIRHNLMLE